jgi:transposase
MWVFASPAPKVTLYLIRLSRGIEVPLEVLGPEFIGTLGIDGWAGYLNLPYDKGQCIAHLLRRCRSLLEVNEQGAAPFPHQVLRVLGEALQVKALQSELNVADYQERVAQVQGSLAALLGGNVAHPLNRKFLNHRLNHSNELLTFLDVPALTPSNNLAVYSFSLLPTRRVPASPFRLRSEAPRR